VVCFAKAAEKFSAHEARIHRPGNEQAIRASKLEPTVEAKEHTTDGLITGLPAMCRRS
jgi:hypothetical protein